MRHCIFCEGSPVTKEDVWPPRWLSRRYPPHTNATVTAERYGIPLGSWPASGTGIQIGCVCPTCNNGWMSQIESDIKPIVEALLEQRAQTIEPDTLHLLAVWAIKNSMVLEGFTPDRRSVYTGTERRLFAEVRTIPSRLQVWLAACVEQTSSFTSNERFDDSEDLPGVYGSATTMAYGPLAIQVLRVLVPDAVPPTTRVEVQPIDGPWNATLVPAWPRPHAPAGWPPQQALNGEPGLRLLSQRFKVAPAA